MPQHPPPPPCFASPDTRLSLQFRFGERVRRLELKSPGSLVLSAILAAIFSWSLLCVLYLAFRDDMLARIVNNQAETQYQYEDRIAALRAHLDRVATRQLVNQDSFEDKVNELIARQSQLETRQAIVSTISGEAQRQGVKQSNEISATAADPARPPARGGAAPRPDDGGRNRAAPGSIPTISSSGFLPGKPRPEEETPKLSLFGTSAGLRLGLPASSQSRIPDRLDHVALALDQIERHQIDAVKSLERNAAAKISRWRSTIAEIGLDPGRFQKARGRSERLEDSVGGPLIPIGDGKDLNAFDKSVLDLQLELSETSKIAPLYNALPLQRPLPGDPIVTSPYGARPDPFFHSLAMHTGIDFKGMFGSAVFATAAGKVISAGQQGGYGNMVEIDHGYGLTTRYAHLSSISVDIGDHVEKDEEIGRIGMTGRTTGPHLHYETRIDGEATDPMRFMHAAARLGLN
jgi:murein DD-endopeptidase MepM/ murein hydrolase activator NlpD